MAPTDEHEAWRDLLSACDAAQLHELAVLQGAVLPESATVREAISR